MASSLLFALVAALLLFPMASEIRPVLIWIVVYFGLPAEKFETPYVIRRIYELALKSRLAVYFGSRSYSIYLVHYPIISIVVWLFFSHSMPLPNILLLSCISIPVIVVISELAYRTIELPGIALGKRIAIAMHSRKHQELMVNSTIDSHSAHSRKECDGLEPKGSLTARPEKTRSDRTQVVSAPGGLIGPRWGSAPWQLHHEIPRLPPLNPAQPRVAMEFQKAANCLLRLADGIVDGLLCVMSWVAFAPGDKLKA
jgi:hypothetical protein